MQTSVSDCLNIPLLLKRALLKLKYILMPQKEVNQQEEVGQSDCGY